MAVRDALQRFVALAAHAGLSPSQSQIDNVEATAHWLAALSQHSGVSGYDTPDSALLRGMAPALAYFSLASAPRGGTVADLGAGNGALGATIAILAPDLRVDLADRAQRAYTACEILAARLALPNLRAVRLDARDYRGPAYDVVLFRALARGSEALALAHRMTAPGGLVIAFHRADDAQFDRLESHLACKQTVPALVPGLVATAYRAD